MPIETLEDILEEFADQMSLYAAGKRATWIAQVKSRIMAAVDIERKLEIVRRTWK